MDKGAKVNLFLGQADPVSTGLMADFCRLKTDDDESECEMIPMESSYNATGDIWADIDSSVPCNFTF